MDYKSPAPLTPHHTLFPVPCTTLCTLDDKAGGHLAARFVVRNASYPRNRNRNATSVAPATSSGPTKSFRKIAWSYLRCM